MDPVFDFSLKFQSHVGIRLERQHPSRGERLLHLVAIIHRDDVIVVAMATSAQLDGDVGGKTG